jgi:hypothetical protein
MKAPCFENEVLGKDPVYDEKAEKAYWDGEKLRITPQVAKAFYDMAKTHYDNGATFPQAVRAIHEQTHLRENTIAKIIAADKTARNLSNDMWYQQARYREIKMAARRMAEQANTPEWVKKADFTWDLLRSSATLYHGGVFPFSHAKNLLLLGNAERKIFGSMVADAYKYMSPHTGRARWARDMTQMMGTDEYKEAIRHGVRARPEDRPLGIVANWVKGWGYRGYDALKPGRVKLYHLWKSRLKEFDDDSLDMLGREVNIATGDIDLPETTGRWLARGSFAPKLFVTRRIEAFTPIRYAVNAGRMTANERAVANQALGRWARHMITAAGILGSNDLINKYLLKNNQRVNWYDFSQPGTLWRMNWGGHIVPLTPMVEIVRTPVAMFAALFKTRRELKGEEAPSAALELASREILNALHPSIIAGIEGITGREVFGVPRHKRRLPFPGVKQLVRGEEPERDPRMGWPEFLGQKAMIPVAEATREIFTPSLTEQGVTKAKADKWVDALLYSALSGTAAVHTFEVSPKSVQQPTRYTKPLGTVRGGVRQR